MICYIAALLLMNNTYSCLFTHEILACNTSEAGFPIFNYTEIMSDRFQRNNYTLRGSPFYIKDGSCYCNEQVYHDLFIDVMVSSDCTDQLIITGNNSCGLIYNNEYQINDIDNFCKMKSIILIDDTKISIDSRFSEPTFSCVNIFREYYCDIIPEPIILSLLYQIGSLIKLGIFKYNKVKILFTAVSITTSVLSAIKFNLQWDSNWDVYQSLIFVIFNTSFFNTFFYLVVIAEQPQAIYLLVPLTITHVIPAYVLYIWLAIPIVLFFFYFVKLVGFPLVNIQPDSIISKLNPEDQKSLLAMLSLMLTIKYAFNTMFFFYHGNNYIDSALMPLTCSWDNYKHTRWQKIIDNIMIV